MLKRADENVTCHLPEVWSRSPHFTTRKVTLKTWGKSQPKSTWSIHNIIGQSNSRHGNKGAWLMDLTHLGAENKGIVMWVLSEAKANFSLGVCLHLWQEGIRIRGDLFVTTLMGVGAWWWSYTKTLLT